MSNIRQAPVLKAGGQGDHYTIWIGGHQSYLFFERSEDLTGNNVGIKYFGHFQNPDTLVVDIYLLSAVDFAMGIGHCVNDDLLVNPFFQKKNSGLK